MRHLRHIYEDNFHLDVDKDGMYTLQEKEYVDDLESRYSRSRFTSDEVYQLDKRYENKFNDDIYTVVIIFRDESGYTPKGYVLVSNDKSHIQIPIVKLEDEWFYIKIPPTRRDTINFRPVEEFYVCDQLDGLFACLDDIIKGVSSF